MPEGHSRIPAPVIAIGECLIDLISPNQKDLSVATELRIREGGAPANVAVGLARLGVPSALRAMVGDDPFGDRLRVRLAAEGVDISGMGVAHGIPTTVAFAWSDAAGNGQFRIHRHADALLSPENVTRDVIAGAAAIVVGSVAMSAEPSRSAILSAIRHASETGVPIVADLNIRPGLVASADDLRFNAAALLSSATVIKLSVDDANALWGASTFAAAAKELAHYAATTIVITDGGRGAALFTDGHLSQVDAFVVDAVEPTGAGDAFTAALVSRMLARGWSVADGDDLRFAMAAGALATTQPGAMDGLPTRDQVEAFLAARIVQ